MIRRMSVASATAWLATIARMTSLASGQAAPERDLPTLTGRIVDENGKPIAGAAVDVFTGDFVDTASLLAQPRIVTAADGAYALPLATTTFSYVILAAAGRQSCAVQVQEPRGQPAMGEFVLVPGGRVQGRVRDESGAPLAGVRVRVESSIPDRFGYLLFALAGTVTDTKGIFVVPGTPPDGLRVILEADGYLTTARLGACDSPLDVSLHRVGMVRGRVVDGSGAGVGPVAIHPITVEERHGFGGGESAADGTFVLTVPSRGPFRLQGLERAPPHREFSSGILHGATDEADLLPVSLVAGRRPIELRVVDAATGRPLPRCWLSTQTATMDHLQGLLFSHGMQRKACDGTCTIHPGNEEGPLVLVVDAPGYAFKAVPVPDDLDHPLAIALGPEAVLTGTITDLETGKPMAGVAVRALPEGKGSGAGMPGMEMPLSDAAGNYRVGSLRAGSYAVQAHAPGRPNSDVFHATVEAGGKAHLDLTVPRPCWLEGELVGEIPPGPALRLSVRAAIDFSPGTGYRHYLSDSGSRFFTKPGRFRFGPVDESGYQLQAFVASRTRAGTGTTLGLGPIPANDPDLRIDLPDLRRYVLRGRIELAPGVPGERIAVIATLPADHGLLESLRSRPVVTGAGTDGVFAMDLPMGSYRLQLADLWTGIVFHTEADLLAVDADTGPMTLAPTWHWLEVACEPNQAGALLVLSALGVGLPRPAGGDLDALLTWSGSDNGLQRGHVPFHDGDAVQRWLVPEGRIQIDAWQHRDLLVSGRTVSPRPVAHADLEIRESSQRVVLKVPALPADADLLRKH